MTDWTPDDLADRIEQAALDAALWPQVLDELSEKVGAKGAILVSTDRLMPGAPVSQGVAEMMDDYFRNGWNNHDIRAERGVPFILTRGVATEPDFTSPDEMRRSAYYQDWVARHGCGHFAGVGVSVAGDLWCLSIQRSSGLGAFEKDDIRKLAALSRPLGEAATLSRQLGFQQILGMANALELVGQAAMLLDDVGRILALNERAEVLLGPAIELKTRSLLLSDSGSRDAFSALVKHALEPALPANPIFRSIAIHLKGRGRISVDAIALRDWARFSFASARALLLFQPDQGDRASEGAGFVLTAAEASLAKEIAAGRSLRDAAEVLGIRYETARSYLKSIFSKTDTHRQGELVARLIGEKYRS